MVTIQIRDARASDRFFLDNELIDIHGKQIGAYGVAVYNVLARYANFNSQECYPSYKTIGEALDISRNAVIAAIGKLEGAGLIGVEKRISTEKGRPTTTSIYTLLAVEKTPPDKHHPGTSEVLASPSKGLPSTSQVPGVVPEKHHPGTSEVPELNVINLTNSNKGGTAARPPKSEALLIEEYFLKQTTGSIGFMNSMQRELITDLTARGYTLEKCKPGIDQTIAEFRAKGKAISSIKICIPAIVQLDPTNQPVFIQNHQQQTRPPADPHEAERNDWIARKIARMEATSQIPVTA